MADTTNTAVTSETRRKNVTVHYIAVTGILSAIAFILQLIEIPAPLMPSFVKLDFSDLPALLGAFAMGPVCGILIELIKNLLHSMASQSFGVGEISNFILGAVMTAVAGGIYQHKKTKQGAILGSLAGAVVMGLVSVPSNYFIVYPVYYNFMPEEVILAAYQALIPSMKSILQCLLCFNLPFTIVKGLLDVVITFVVYPYISPILHGRK